MPGLWPGREEAEKPMKTIPGNGRYTQGGLERIKPRSLRRALVAWWQPVEVWA